MTKNIFEKVNNSKLYISLILYKEKVVSMDIM